MVRNSLKFMKYQWDNFSNILYYKKSWEKISFCNLKCDYFPNEILDYSSVCYVYTTARPYHLKRKFQILTHCHLTNFLRKFFFCQIEICGRKYCSLTEKTFEKNSSCDSESQILRPVPIQLKLLRSASP